MKIPTEPHGFKRAQGVPFLIIAAIFIIIGGVLWLNDFGELTASAPFAFGLFLVACGIQSFIKPSSEGRANRNPIALFTNDKWSIILGLIPLLYAVGVALYMAPMNIRVFIGFSIIFVGLIISYLRDFFRPMKKNETNTMEKFYKKTAEVEDALGLERGIGGEDVATRKVSLKKKAGLLGELLSVAPWQLIAAIVLAQVFSVFMCFFR